MQEGIEFLQLKMAELEEQVDKLNSKEDYDDRWLLVEKITLLDELIIEMKRIEQKKD